MDTPAHPYADTTLDTDLIADVLEAVKRTRIGLETLVDDQRDFPNIHRELRHLVGESPTDDVLALPDPAGDLYDIIDHLLADYEAALTRLHALAAAPADPAREYERLLRAAEKELEARNMHSDTAPARAETLAKIADRWLSEALVNAQTRSKRADGSVTHFGSPQASPGTASIEQNWRTEIAAQVRRHCTPSSHAYAKGGDVLIAAVADWIENPPAWLPSARPAVGGITGPLNTAPARHSLAERLADVGAVMKYFAARLVEVIVVVDAKGALYLVSDNEDAPFYVGIPQAEDEDGTTVDPNKGRLDRTPDGRGLPVFPLVVIGAGHGASYPQP